MAGRDLNALIPEGLSKNQIAIGTGISRSMIACVFNGRRAPSLRVAETLAAYLGVSLDKFTSHLRTMRPKIIGVDTGKGAIPAEKYKYLQPRRKGAKARPTTTVKGAR